MNTHSFKLPSGVPCTVKELTAKHQRMLTEQKNKTMHENLNEVLADVIVELGDRKQVSVDFVRAMLSEDRKLALCEVRQFTMDFDPLFKFTFDYLSSTGEKEKAPLEIDLSEGFKAKPYMVIHPESGELVAASYESYDEIKRTIEITLPKSGQKVKFDLLDGEAEVRAQKIKKADRNSHSAILIRKPRYMHNNGSSEVEMGLRLDDLSIKDIEYLRTQIKAFEGKVDTEAMIEHPEAETKTGKDKEVIVDLLSTLAFFFPSEAI